MIARTSQATESSAQICRENGWTVGMGLWAGRLPKEQPGPPLRVRITAIGQRRLLVWHEAIDDEIDLDLHARDWFAVR